MILYQFKNRIILIRKMTVLYEPVEIDNVVWFYTSSVPDEVIKNSSSYSYSLNNGFKFVNENFLVEKEEIFDKITKIQLYEKFNGFANTCKLKYTKNVLGQGLFESLLIAEVYGTPSVLIDSLVKTDNYSSIEVAVESLKLKYEDAKRVFSHILEVKKQLKELLSNKNYNEAKQYIDDQLEKINL